MTSKNEPVGLDALHKKLDETLETRYREHDALKEFLSKAKKQYKEVDVLGNVVKIKPVIPKGVRHFTDEIRKREDEPTLDESEESTYRLLAAMCVEEPFTDPEFWKVLDDETGIAIGLLNQFYEVAYETQKAIKSVR